MSSSLNSGAVFIILSLLKAIEEKRSYPMGADHDRLEQIPPSEIWVQIDLFNRLQLADDPAGFMESQVHPGLNELATRVACEHATRHVLFSPHSARREIVRFAEENSIDLIVLGSHGLPTSTTPRWQYEAT